MHLSLNIPEEILEQDIPKMSLQPVVENAILHGIEPLGEESTIYIKGWYENDICVIEITDAGRGMTEEELEKMNKKLAGEVEATGGKGNGIGLKNVQDRIKMSFGDKYGVTVSTKLDCYTKVALQIPRAK